MDPVSFVASLIALYGAVCKISKAVNTVGSGLKNAEKEVEQAIRQLSTIQNSLGGLEILKELHGHFPYNLPDTLETINATQEFLSEVERTFPKLISPTGLRLRIKWAFKNRHTVAKLSADFHKTAPFLNLCWQIEHAQTSRLILPAILKMSSSQDSHNYHIKGISDEVSRIREVVETKAEFPEHSSKALAEISQQTSNPSSMRKWLLTSGIMVLYWRSRPPKKHKRRNQRQVVFGVVLPASKVIFARISPSNGLQLNIRNIIPSDAEIVKACKAGDELAVKSLLQDRKASPNDVTEENHTVLMHAIDSNCPSLVELLLQQGADPNQQFGRWQTSPLQVAFETRQPEIARKLLRFEADIHYISARGWPVISYLWEKGKTDKNLDEFFEISSANGFDSYDVGDRAGWIPLHRASAFGKRKDIQNILKLSGSFTATKNDAWTPIHVATALNNVQTLEVLAENSPYSLHTPDARGFTPLHIAADRGAEHTMEFLIRNGANPHEKSSIVASSFPVGFEHESVTPGDLARAQGLDFWIKYIDALKAADWPIHCCDDELYWDLDNLDENDSEYSTEKKPLWNEKLGFQ